MAAKKIIDGEVGPNEFNINNARTIDELLGKKENSFSPWKARNVEELNKKIEEMNLADLQKLATRVGIIPVHDRRLLKQRLVKQFESENKAKSRPPASKKNDKFGKNVSKEQEEKVLRILRQGR